MTFYEELGVPPDAPQDSIREAYRNVARLLHPDAQTNPVLKESAEVQMKRINHLYETLADPERRRRYDQELAGPSERPGAIIIQAPAAPKSLQGNKRGTYVWLAASAICATFVLWLATRESSEPAVYPPPPSGLSSGAPSSLRKVAAAILPNTNSDRQRDGEIVRLRAELAAAYADRERLLKQIAILGAPKPSPGPLMPSPAPLVAQVVPMDIPMSARTELPAYARPAVKPRWSGLWAYSHPRTENTNKSLFPPEFIEASISEENGRIRGQYHARFEVSPARISPDVDFHFDGMISGMAGRYSWTGTGGAKGEVQLRLISDTTLEIVWSATELGSSMGLASGTAVLNRKN